MWVTTVMISFIHSIQFWYLANLNKHQLTLNTCMWHQCLFILRTKFIPVIIIQFTEDPYFHGLSQSEEAFCQLVLVMPAIYNFCTGRLLHVQCLLLQTCIFVSFQEKSQTQKKFHSFHVKEELILQSCKRCRGINIGVEN